MVNPESWIRASLSVNPTTFGRVISEACDPGLMIKKLVARIAIRPMPAPINFLRFVTALTDGIFAVIRSPLERRFKSLSIAAAF